MNKKFIIFIIFVAILILGMAAFFYFRGAVFSKEVLKLEILGSETAKVGDEITYTVTYKNNGNFALEKPKLVFELPDNSLTEDGKVRFAQDLQDVYPGQEGLLTFKARLLGKEGDVKTAKAWFSYMPRNLSVRYESDTTLNTMLGPVGISLTYDLPSKMETGGPVTYAINYFSNVDYPLENMSIKLDAVNGFNFQSSDPTSLDPNEYKLTTLQKGQGGRININGSWGGSVGGVAVFNAHLGMWRDGTFVVVKDVSQEVQTIPSTASPLLTLHQDLTSGDAGMYTVHWHVENKVNGVKNVKVKATLPVGATLGDEITPEAQLNNFSWDSASRQIVWLVGDLGVGNTLDVSFQVTPLPGQNPIAQSNVSGEDQFTGAPVQGSITQ